RRLRARGTREPEERGRLLQPVPGAADGIRFRPGEPFAGARDDARLRWRARLQDPAGAQRRARSRPGLARAEAAMGGPELAAGGGPARAAPAVAGSAGMVPAALRLDRPD